MKRLLTSVVIGGACIGVLVIGRSGTASGSTQPPGLPPKLHPPVVYSPPPGQGKAIVLGPATNSDRTYSNGYRVHVLKDNSGNVIGYEITRPGR